MIAKLILKANEKLMLLLTISIILLILIPLLLWLLIEPIIIKIDTITNEYYIRWRHIGSVALLFLNDDLLLRLRILFWQKDFYPLHAQKKQEKPKKKPTKKAKSKWKRFSWRRMKAILRTFKVRYFRMDLDTDDYVLNAYLYPLFYFANRPNRRLSVNFEGRTNVQLQVENRLLRIVRAFIF